MNENSYHRLFIAFFMAIYCGLLHADVPVNNSKVLRGGWYWFEPYQYLNKTAEAEALIGLDIQIAREVAKTIEVNLDIPELPWHTHIERIRNGEADFAVGATFTEERAQFAYFSVPYRFEENSLFVRRSDEEKFRLKTVKELLSYVEKNHLKIGIVEGFVYADPLINEWIKKDSNKAIIAQSKDDRENVKKLSHNEIVAFMSDRISGATAVWREKLGEEITEIKLGLKTPIHFMFSKKTVERETVDEVNHAIEHLKMSRQFDQIISFYLHPVLLLQTVDTLWFRLIEIIGGLSLAISGLIIAYNNNATMFGAVIFALLPSLGGSIIRDLVFDRFPVRAMAKPGYFLMVLGVVALGYILVKVMEKYRLHHIVPASRKNWLVHILATSEALGLAAYTISGIVISVVVKVSPLWLWGPFFALITGAGGGIIRDLLSKNRDIMALRGGILPEIAIIWGLFLSIFLTVQSHSVDTDSIKFALIFTVVGIFVTRMIIYVFKVPNIYLRKP